LLSVFKVATIYEHNNLGPGAKPQLPEASGGWGWSPQRFGGFYMFFLKNYPFLGIFWSKFLIKTRFYFTAKCVGAPAKSSPVCMTPTSPFLVTPLHIICSNENMLSFF